MVLVLEAVGVDVDRRGHVPAHHAERGEVVVIRAGRDVLVVDLDQHVLRGGGDVLVEAVGELLLAHRRRPLPARG